MDGSIHALNSFSFLFDQDGGYLRIPIWGHIPLSRAARRIIEHPDFVRLQRIRQLGLVYYVFPGATHTRFEHSIGAYHLSVLLLQRIVLNPANWESPETPKISPDEARIFLAAALLHDIGHYPFAHLIDRIPGPDGCAFESHEDRAREYILADGSPGSIPWILREEWGIDEPERVADVITDPFGSGLPGRMLSGILDPDKMDYLMRDASACGVPYGNIDVDRLIESLVLDVDGPDRRLGITEKGIAPLESLVFAKYMMFRHIYWHHTVRVAAAMFTRFIQDGLEYKTIDASSIYDLSDDALIERLAEPCSPRPCMGEGLGVRVSGSTTSKDIPSRELIVSLGDRRLYKRGLTFYPEHAVGEDEFALTVDEFERVKDLYWHPELRKEKEIAICRLISSDLQGHEILLDIPRISSVFDLDDFRDLRVLVRSQVGAESQFVSFNSYGFTQLTADFAQEFERYSRHLQVICRPDLRNTVVQHRSEIKAIVVG